ncbi:hypothetical protein JS565_03900 [Salmonella enterica subsp. enterica serovar Senftenberg]|nr:hypothetical protein [Salmonella enterica subsp. enterica serovar Senftenberg]
MNKIIKRLEIIKSAIELEDEEIIRQQLIYLKNEPQDAVISAIAGQLKLVDSVTPCKRSPHGYRLNGRSRRGKILYCRQ